MKAGHDSQAESLTTESPALHTGLSVVARRRITPASLS